MDFKNIGFREIMEINSLTVLAGTVATLHAASAVNSVEDYRYALRCKKAGLAIKVRKPIASNSNTNKINKGGPDKAEQRVKLAMRGDLRTRILRPV
jgi:hypothetical protein